MIPMVAAVLLTGCSSVGQRAEVTAAATTAPSAPRSMFSVARYGAASPRVVADNAAVPRGGGRDMVGRPYQVDGRWYYPKEDPNYSVVGLASWYGSDFHGRRTANGEVFNMNALTAAHPTMPLPSYARVTNLQNGHSLMVRVNDRGPFHSNRVIDVSAKAAEMLGMVSSGVAQVQVEYVGRAAVNAHDESILMASYTQGRPGTVPSLSSSVQLALAAGSPPGAQPAAAAATIQLAMNTPPAPVPAGLLLPRPVLTSKPATAAPANYNPFTAGLADAMFTPAAVTGPDPLGPIIAAAPNANLYAAEPARTPAQNAVDAFAAGGNGLSLRGTIPAAETATIAVGTFDDRGAVNRLVSGLSAYGAVNVAESAVAGRQVWTVSVNAAADNADDALRAAAMLGATGVTRTAN